MFRLFLASLLLLLSVSVAQAASYRKDVENCAELMRKHPAKIEVTYNFGKINYDFSKASKEIPIPDNGVKVSGTIKGMTNFAPYVGVDTYLAGAPLSEDRYCIYPSAVKVRVGYNPTVYIEKGLKSGSCKYNLTMRHEQTHLRIGHQILLMFAQALKIQVPQIVEKIGPQVSREFIKAKNEMEIIYRKRIADMVSVFIAALEQKNMELDTKENYDKEDSLCKLSLF